MTTPTVTETRRAGQTNERVELTRYTVTAGERVIHGQRVLGVVRLVDDPVSGDGRHVERRQAGQPPCAHDLLAIAAEFGNTAVDNLRTVLACYEAMRASDALTT